MDKATAETIRDEIKNAIAAVLEQHGLTLDRRSVSYGDHSCTVKLEIREAGNNKFEADFLEWVSYHGYVTHIKAEDLNCIFKLGKNQYQLIGADRKKRKQPMIVQRLGEDKLYQIDCLTLAKALGRFDGASK